MRHVLLFLLAELGRIMTVDFARAWTTNMRGVAYVRNTYKSGGM